MKGTLSVCEWNNEAGAGTGVRYSGSKNSREARLTLHVSDPRSECLLKLWPRAPYSPQPCAGLAEADCTYCTAAKGLSDP